MEGYNSFPALYQHLLAAVTHLELEKIGTAYNVVMRNLLKSHTEIHKHINKPNYFLTKWNIRLRTYIVHICISLIMRHWIGIL